MANYNSMTCTQKTFHVSDIDAFKKAFEPLLSDIHISENADGTVWIGGYDVAMTVLDQEDNEVEIAEIIQKHIMPDDYAVIQSVGYEKLRFVDGYVVVISKEKILTETLQSMTDNLVEQIKEKKT